GEQVVLRTPGPVEEQQRQARWVPWPRHETVDETPTLGGRRQPLRERPAAGRPAHGSCPCSFGSRIRGRAASTSARWGSIRGGRLRRVPRESGSSSTAKPGPSVAISNSTPPGSRK